LTHLWLSVLSSITNHNIQYHNYKCDILDNIDHTSHIKIKSYNELVNKISKLVNSQYQILCSMKDRSNGLQSTMDNNSIDNTHLDNRNKSSYNICIIYFDGIDSVDSYDNTLSYQLLHIGKVLDIQYYCCYIEYIFHTTIYSISLLLCMLINYSYIVLPT
jgi:hypothetical protein